MHLGLPSYMGKGKGWHGEDFILLPICGKKAKPNKVSGLPESATCVLCLKILGEKTTDEIFTEVAKEIGVVYAPDAPN